MQWINQVHMPRSDQPLRDILARMRHEHCGGRAARAELVSGTEAASKGLLLLGWGVKRAP